MNDRLESTSDRLDLAADTSSIHTAQEAILQYARDLRALNVSTEQDFLSLKLRIIQDAVKGMTIWNCLRTAALLSRNGRYASHIPSHEVPRWARDGLSKTHGVTDEAKDDDFADNVQLLTDGEGSL